MGTAALRQSVSLPGLRKEVRHCFGRIPDSKSNTAIPLADHLMAGLAVFGLKYPSLLQFDQDRNVELIRYNLNSLYGIEQAPCDTYHQLRGAVLVHPDQREVFALAPEPIMQQDGANKNDCERNAARRLLTDTRREHPHLKLIVVEDALASNAPHVRLLQELNYRFILGAKPGDHPFLFDWVARTTGTVEFETTDEQGMRER